MASCLLLAERSLAYAQVPPPRCLESNVTVTVTGTLERRTYPGPPNYESVAPGDLAETGFYLVLGRPICTTDDELAGPQSDVRLVQLVLDQASYDLCARDSVRQFRFRASCSAAAPAIIMHRCFLNA